VTDAGRTHDRRLLERLSAYLDGDLPESECEAIANHARTCSRCAAVLDGLKRATGLCRAAATRPLPPDVRRRAKRRIEALMASAATKDATKKK